MLKIDGKQIAVYLEHKQIQRLDVIAEKHGLKRAQALRLILDTGLDAYDTFAVIGIPQLAELVKRTKKACEKQVQPTLFEGK